MQALILIGHGSLQKASGADMIRLAAQVRHEDISPLSGAAFLNFSKPTLLETATRLVAKGATSLVVQPYFLIPGYYVHTVLPKQVREVEVALSVPVTITEAFGYHPALAAFVKERAGEGTEEEALLLMAHGTPKVEANTPIYEVAREVAKRSRFKSVLTCFMEINEPDIAGGVNQLVAQGVKRIVAVPYFLQLGGHVQEDIPNAIAAAQEAHPQVRLELTSHLTYDGRLLEVIRDRVEVAFQSSLIQL